MASIPESWLQDVAASVQLPALNPTATRVLLPAVELHIRKLVQQAHKFQRRSKRKRLTVDDFNMSLSSNKLEEVYGLTNASVDATVKLAEIAKLPLPDCPVEAEVSLHWLAVVGVQPMIPENPEVILDVKDSSDIKDSGAAGEKPTSLPLELQQFYARVVSLLSTAALDSDNTGSRSSSSSQSSTAHHIFGRSVTSSSNIANAARNTGITYAQSSGYLPPRNKVFEAVLTALQCDEGLQELLPYFSRFLYSKIKENIKGPPALLTRLILCIRALMLNVNLRLEFHLQQLLPAVFTCILASRLSSSDDAHWEVRRMAAQLIQIACHKYCAVFTDLQARACKTYTDALGAIMGDVFLAEEQLGDETERANTQSREGAGGVEDMQRDAQINHSLATAYGGIVGLSALGVEPVRAVLMPCVARLMDILDEIEEKRSFEKRGQLSTSHEASICSAIASVGASVGRHESMVEPGSISSNKSRHTISSVSDGGKGRGRVGSGVSGAVQQCRTALLLALGRYITKTLEDSFGSYGQSEVSVFSANVNTNGRSRRRSAHRDRIAAHFAAVHAALSLTTSSTLGHVANPTTSGGGGGAGKIDGGGVQSAITSSPVSVPLKKKQPRERRVHIQVPDCFQESLVPFFVSKSNDLTYCRLFV